MNRSYFIFIFILCNTVIISLLYYLTTLEKNDAVLRYFESIFSKNTLKQDPNEEISTQCHTSSSARMGGGASLESKDQVEKSTVLDPFSIERKHTVPTCNESLDTCASAIRLDNWDHAYLQYKNVEEPILVSSSRDIISPTLYWPALYWNYWHWAAERWPILKNVLQLSSEDQAATFITHDEGRGSLSNPNYSVLDEILLWDYLRDVELSSETKLCRFYSTDYVELEQHAHLENDTEWRKYRIKDPNLPKDYQDFEISPIFSILYPGCALKERYNEFHTTKVQLKGSSTYTLISPDKVSELFPFPYVHSAAHQMQLNWREVSFTKKANPISVKLELGQVLLIPPGWVVYEQANNLSVTLDVLSPSQQQLSLLETLAIQMPIPTNISTTEQTIHAQVFLAHVLSRINGITSIQRFSKHLLKTRYSLLYPPNSLLMQQSSFDCLGSNEQEHQRIVSQINKVRMIKAAEFVAERFNAKHFVGRAKWLWLSNFVESVVRSVYPEGSLINVALFFRECLNIEGKIEVMEEVEGGAIHLNPIY